MSDADYYELTPDRVLDAIESAGIELDGSLLTLNSYENRVYRIKKYSGEPLVAKFYRPHRWSDEAIYEEHAFAKELQDAEIPLIAPLSFDTRGTLLYSGSYRFSLFPCHGGRAPELDREDHLLWLGRFMARIHNVGATTDFTERPELDCKTFGRDCIDFLKVSGYIPREIEESYFAIAEHVLTACNESFDSLPNYQKLRLHCDCHPGNILWTDEGPHIVDLDDSRMGPAVQDLWMFLGGDSETMTERLDILLEGYEEFRDFDQAELALIEPLRSLRMIHYSAWLARRWEDPSFKHHFPWFAESRYWEEQILGLKEQLAAINDPPLKPLNNGNC